jgi:lipopolysaccharide/colanic/teichoic acid biosynthesis glycosyltransferase
MGAPVLFRQIRSGKHGVPFELLKLRTMRGQGPNESSDDHLRQTTIGNLLRRTSIDELPGLVNVIRGDMALVGPRPLMHEYIDRYSSEQLRRFEVLPGLTGWAQVTGRNLLSWDEKFNRDVWYVDNRSLALDIEIILMTVFRLIQSFIARSEETRPATLFVGSEPRNVGSTTEILEEKQ